MNKDSKEILQKAEDLLQSNKDCLETDIEADERVTKKGSYDIETQKEIDKSSEEQKKIKKASKESQKFYIPKLGYKREIHYKKPKWYHFLFAICAIVILLLIIGTLMPYIRPQ